MIIIEGADCTGKSTLAAQLWSHPRLQEYGMEIQHLSRLPTGHDRCWHYINRMNRNGIFDRFHYSELAYAEARGDTEVLLTPLKMTLVEKMLEAVCPYRILLLMGSYDHMVARWNKDEMYDRVTVWRANEAFRKMRHTRKWDYVHCSALANHFPTVTDIEHIVASYVSRRTAWQAKITEATSANAS